MRAKRITANLRVADIEPAKSFYTDYLGLSTENFKSIVILTGENWLGCATSACGHPRSAQYAKPD
jgi:catechol 2,3-dioxygenase-like lactoylglutathione lyase family enzyme